MAVFIEHETFVPQLISIGSGSGKEEEEENPLMGESSLSEHPHWLPLTSGIFFFFSISIHFERACYVRINNHSHIACRYLSCLVDAPLQSVWSWQRGLFSWIFLISFTPTAKCQSDLWSNAQTLSDRLNQLPWVLERRFFSSLRTSKPHLHTFILSITWYQCNMEVLLKSKCTNSGTIHRFHKLFISLWVKIL